MSSDRSYLEQAWKRLCEDRDGKDEGLSMPFSNGNSSRQIESFLQSALAVNSIDDNRREMETVPEINNESAFPNAQRKKRSLEDFEGKDEGLSGPQVESFLQSALAVNSIDDNRQEMETVAEINNESAFPNAQRKHAPKKLISPTPKEQKGKKVNGDRHRPCEKFAMEIKQKKGERHYRGVRQRRPGRFSAEIRDPTRKGGKRWLGTFDNRKAAALAYDRAAYKIRGPRAQLNFARPTVEEPKSDTPSSSASHHLIHPVITAHQRGDKRYRGVLQKRSGKFEASISHPKWKGAKILLGIFNNDTEAARAYDHAAYEMRGSKAVLNFPSIHPVITAPQATSSHTHADVLTGGGGRREISFQEAESSPLLRRGKGQQPILSEHDDGESSPVKSTPSVSHHSIHPVITAPQATSSHTHADVLTGGGGRREISFQDLHPEVLGEKEENEKSSRAKQRERKNGYHMYLRCYPKQKEKILDFAHFLLKREREKGEKTIQHA